MPEPKLQRLLGANASKGEYGPPSRNPQRRSKLASQQICARCRRLKRPRNAFRSPGDCPATALADLGRDRLERCVRSDRVSSTIRKPEQRVACIARSSRAWTFCRGGRRKSGRIEGTTRRSHPGRYPEKQRRRPYRDILTLEREWRGGFGGVGGLDVRFQRSKFAEFRS